jgi:hypothetical protein
MESLLDWGIDVVLWFQQFSPTLDLPFKTFTFLGDKEFCSYRPVAWLANRLSPART